MRASARRSLWIVGLGLAASMAWAAEARAEEPAPATPTDGGAAKLDTSGWATFGGELGFFVGGATGAVAMVAILNASGSDSAQTPPEDGGSQHGAGPLLGLGLMAHTLGSTALGAWGFGRMARENHWDPHDGWGAAGVLPGIMEGFALGGGALLFADPDAGIAPRMGAAGIGAGLGGVLGYTLFRAMAERRGAAGWETFGFWTGFFVGEISGIVAGQSMPGGTQENGHFILLGAAAGGIIGTGLAHLLAPVRHF